MRHQLTVFIDPHYAYANALHEAYNTHVHAHNRQHDEQSHSGSGFDLLVPQVIERDDASLGMLVINYHVTCVLQSMPRGAGETEASAFCVYPRPILAKTRLRSVNAVEVIDAGCRSGIRVAFDILPDDQTSVLALARQRLVQICAPDLAPIRVSLAPLGTVPQ